MAIETLSNPFITVLTPQAPKFSRVTDAGEFRPDAIADGYALECSCGELYRSVASAIHCRKCRNYCVFGYCTHVVDIRTGEVVAGKVPSQEEYRQAAMAAAARWEEERKEFEASIEMESQSGPAWEEHLVLTRQQSEEEKEEELWDIQDTMMGVQ